MKASAILLLFFLSFSFSACRPRVDKLSHANAPDYILISRAEEDSFKNEVKEVIKYYIETEDARNASPKHHITVLHLAAWERDLALVKHLLKQGADPNARLLIDGKEADTPIALALSGSPSEISLEDALRIERTHIEAGADINIPGFWGWSPLSICAKRFDDFSYQLHTNTPRAHLHGQVAIELMKMGAHAGEQEARLFARCGWKPALEYLFATEEGSNLRRDIMLLHECAETISGAYCSERSSWQDELLNNV